MKSRFSYWTLVAALAMVACVQAVGFGQHHRHVLPPEIRLLEPGPGVGGPGPGVIPPAPTGFGIETLPAPTVQILFATPEGMMVRWDISGHNMFDSEPLIVPGRNEFPQDGIYRLKVTNIEGLEGVELYPTIEIAPVTPRTEAYLAHNAIPVQFTTEDFDQVLAGNFVTKVIYLPDPEFQEAALPRIDTLISTRLDPGVDPIVEADRRGSILAVIRIGNKDLEMPGMMGGIGVMPAAYMAHGATVGGAPCYGCYGGDGMGGYGGGYGPPSLPGYVAGVTLPEYGMPISGTPIGLPGPPHIPFGAPAGLQKHVIKNHTHMNIPEPVEKFKIHVKQNPGYSYPQPVSRMRIHEQNIYPSLPYGVPHYMQKNLPVK